MYSGLGRERGLERRDLRLGALPEGMVLCDVTPQGRLVGQRRAQCRPGRLRAQALAEMPQTGCAQQTLDGVDLRHPRRHEVPTARQRLAQRPNGRRGYVDDRAVDPPAQPLTELERIAPIALLPWPMRLDPHLVRIDDHRAQSYPGQLARGVERHGAGLERHGRLGR